MKILGNLILAACLIALVVLVGVILYLKLSSYSEFFRHP